MSQCVSVIRSVPDEVPSQHQPDPYPPDHSPPRPADVDLELRSGRIFNTEDDVFNFVKSYSSNVRAAFSCTSNNKKQMRFLCKHRPAIHKSTSTRLPIQRVNDLNCKAKIFFYKKKNGNITLTSFFGEHSHSCSERMYHRDTDKIDREDDKELIEALVKANCKPQIIRRRLREENGKIVTVDAVRHAIKSFDKNKDNLKNLNQYLDSLVINGSSINYDVYGNGTVRFISIATKKMKKAYLNAAPPVIQCDTTYNYETSGYKLSAVIYLNETTGKGEVAQLSFHADETAETYKDIFQSLRSFCPTDPPIVIVDKDFIEIECLRETCPSARIILCTFHVIKYMKGVIATAHGKPFSEMSRSEITDHKEEMMQAFNTLMYSRTQNDYEIKKISWYEAIEGVEIFLGAGHQVRETTLRIYYDECWEPVQDMWARYARTMLPLGNEHTNNRIERSFRSMKDLLKWSIPGRVDISQAIPSLVNWAEEQLDDRYTDAQCHSVRISDPDPELAAIYKEAGQVLTYMATKQLKKTIDLMVRREDKMTVLEIGVQERLIKNNEEIIIQYETTPEACSCTFVRQFNCPCRHMLLLRRTLGLPLFDLSLYAPQHLVNRCHDPLVQEHEHQELLGKNPNRINQHGHDDVDEAEHIEKVLLPSQKHNIVFPKLQRISNLLCSFHGTKSFLSYVEEIDIIEQRVRRGQSIFSEMDTILEEDIDKVVEPEEIAEINVKDCDRETVDKGGESLEDTTHICGEGGSFNLKFMAKVKSRGRPRGTGASRTSFKNKKKNMKKKNKTDKGKRLIDLTDQKDTDTSGLNPVSMRDRVICLHPPGIWNIPLFTVDYMDLVPGKWLGDQLVDFYLAYVHFQQDEYRKSEILVIPSNFYAKLSRENEFGESFIESWRWMKDYDLWGAGPNTLVLPVCRNNHWVTLVARLGENPLMVLLNSLSGGPTIITIEAELFRDFLLSHTSSSGLVFTFVTPLVPQQPNFQDCGLFAIKYAELVISDPKKFFQIVTDTEAKQQLSNWFSYYEMENKRGEMAEIIRNLAEEQRREGGPLYGEDLEIPSMDFSKAQEEYQLMGLGILDAQDVREAGEKEKRRVEREMQCDDVDTPLNLTVYPTKPQSISEVPSATSRDSWKVESDTLQVKSFVESPRSSTVLKHEDSSLQEFNRGIKNFFLSRSVNEKKVVKLPAIQPPSRKCGFCRQSGHRRNKCPKIAEFNSCD